MPPNPHTAQEKQPDIPNITLYSWMSMDLGLKQNLLTTYAFVHHFSPNGAYADMPVVALAAFTGVDLRRAENYLENLSHRQLLDLTKTDTGYQCRTLVYNEAMAKSYCLSAAPTAYSDIADNLHFPVKGLTVPGWILTDAALYGQLKLLYAFFYQINRNGQIMGTFADLTRIFAFEKETSLIALKSLHKRGYLCLERITDTGFICLIRDMGLTQKPSPVRLKVPDWIIHSLCIPQAAPLIFYAIINHYRKGAVFKSTYTDFEQSFGFDKVKVNGYLTFLRLHGVLDVIEEGIESFSCRPLATHALAAQQLFKNRQKTPKGRARSSVDSTLRQQVFDRDGHRCRYCGQSGQLTVDHIVPVSRGGTNALSNLQTLCFACNNAKSNRMHFDPDICRQKARTASDRHPNHTKKG